MLDLRFIIKKKRKYSLMKVIRFASALIMSTMTGNQALMLKAGTKEAALLQEGMAALASYAGSNI